MAETLLKYGAKPDLRNRVMEVTDLYVFAYCNGRNSLLIAIGKKNSLLFAMDMSLTLC